MCNLTSNEKKKLQNRSVFKKDYSSDQKTVWALYKELHTYIHICIQTNLKNLI